MSRISDNVRAMEKNKTKNVQLGVDIHIRTRGVDPKLLLSSQHSHIGKMRGHVPYIMPDSLVPKELY
jgi:hypothetical protein